MTAEFIDADVLIIGGGPAGCSCALYTARSSLKTCILDKNSAIGALAITHKIANYPGVDSDLSGADLLEIMRKQAIRYGAEYYRVQVFGVDLSPDRKIVYTPEGTFRGKTLVLATGAMGRSTSTLPGEETYLGRGVSYCATCDGAFHRNQDVVVYGSNQEAVDEALVLTRFASTVHWVTNTKPMATKRDVDQLKAHFNVRHWSRTRLVSIDGNEEGVTNVTLQGSNAIDVEILNVSGAFVYSTGSLPIVDCLRNQVCLTDEGGVKVDEAMMTNVDGVWAIGDIRNTPFKQAVVACSDGCIAAMGIDKYLNQRKQIRVDWVHR